jgi:hypothetical protein
VLPAPETGKDEDKCVNISGHSYTQSIQRGHGSEIYGGIPYPNRLWTFKDVAFSQKAFCKISERGQNTTNLSRRTRGNENAGPVNAYRTLPGAFTWLNDISPNPGTDKYNTIGWSFTDLGTYHVGVHAGLLDHKHAVFNYLPRPSNGVWIDAQTTLTREQIALLVDSKLVIPVDPDADVVTPGTDPAVVRAAGDDAGVPSMFTDDTKETAAEKWDCKNQSPREYGDIPLTGAYVTIDNAVEELKRYMDYRTVPGISNKNDIGVEFDG